MHKPIVFIESLKVEDLNAVNSIQPEGWDDVLPKIKFYLESDFCFPIKASINNELVGIGSSILHDNIAWLGHIIVHPNYRNMGIGKQITQALIDDLNLRNIESIVLIATDLGAIIYTQLHFKTESNYLFFKDLKPVSEFKSEYICHINSVEHKQILELDHYISGENRIKHIQPFINTGFIYKKQNLIEGIYLPDFGEGLIEAKTAEAGIELMKYRMHSQTTASFPEQNEVAIQFLKSNQFLPFKTAKRMQLGKLIPWKAENIYNRIAGNIG